MKKRVLTTVLCGLAISVGSCAQASIFDSLKKKASGVAKKATSIVSTAKDKAATLSAKAKNVTEKASQVAEKAKGSKDSVVNIAEKVGIFNEKMNKAFTVLDKANQKVSAASKKIDEGKQKLGITEQNEALEATNETEETAGEFSKEVMNKIDNLFPSEDEFKKLRNISLEGQSISDKEVPYLTEKLSKLAETGSKKISLSFKGCEISLDSIQQLLDSLKSYPQFIGSLNFSGTSLGDSGAVSIASNFSNFPMLKYVYFANMGISGNGAVAIVSVLSQQAQNDSSNLQLIDLSNNAITEEHVGTLVESWNTIKGHENVVMLLHDNPTSSAADQNVPDNIKLNLK